MLEEVPELTALKAVGAETKRLFQTISILAAENTELDSSFGPQLAAEADRFGLWAVNLGLFVSGHGSLDYRVREADNVKSTIHGFMTSLNESLHDVLEFCGGNAETSEHNTSGDSAIDLVPEIEDSFDGGWDDESNGNAELDVESLLEGIRDPIDRLYKLSSWIRHPSYRVPSAKMLAYQQIDPQTGKDLLEVVEDYDLDYIRSIFLDYRRLKEQSENPERCPKRVKDEVAFDISTNERELREARLLDGYEYLIRRLARANVRRRQQFAYWKRHREKLVLHADAAELDASAQQLPACNPEKLASVIPALKETLGNNGEMALSVTTATRLNIARHLPILDDRSTVSVSVYAPSNWKPGNEALDFPPPPKNPNKERFIECHCCFTTCPKAIAEVNAWRAHLIHDLRPYVCTYKDCKTPDQLYDSRQAWAQHENSMHRRVFRCPEHLTQIFHSAREYEVHIRDEHLDSDDSVPLGVIVQAGESSLDVPDRSCPVCLVTVETTSAMQKHIALHLERFSLFSLPRNGGEEHEGSNDESNEDGENDAISQKAYADDEGSRERAWSRNSSVKAGSGISSTTWGSGRSDAMRVKPAYVAQVTYVTDSEDETDEDLSASDNLELAELLRQRRELQKQLLESGEEVGSIFLDGDGVNTSQQRINEEAMHEQKPGHADSGDDITSEGIGEIQEYPHRARATWTYVAVPGSKELSFQKGEILEVDTTLEEWWDARNANGKRGIVPASYLSLIDSDELSLADKQASEAPPVRDEEDEEDWEDTEDVEDVEEDFSFIHSKESNERLQFLLKKQQELDAEVELFRKEEEAAIEASVRQGMDLDEARRANFRIDEEYKFSRRHQSLELQLKRLYRERAEAEASLQLQQKKSKSSSPGKHRGPTVVDSRRFII
ncbi:hypothetical protein TWF696_001793 [Orbilia brochopaga]|uniref:SH3 domain-containing protein n=1 Tax=Orbilia brochopaga TaxID=3140254 RepID=A0AAV9U6E0_9PEZI